MTLSTHTLRHQRQNLAILQTGRAGKFLYFIELVLEIHMLKKKTAKLKNYVVFVVAVANLNQYFMHSPRFLEGIQDKALREWAKDIHSVWKSLCWKVMNDE